MLTLNNKYVSRVVPTLSGEATFDLTIPGTYTADSPAWESGSTAAVLNNGRMLNSIRVLTDSFQLGDMIESICVIDRDGGVVRTTDDEFDKGIFIPAAGFVLDRTTSPIFMPSETRLVVKMKKASATSTANFYVTVGWFLEE